MRRSGLPLLLALCLVVGCGGKEPTKPDPTDVLPGTWTGTLEAALYVAPDTIRTQETIVLMIRPPGFVQLLLSGDDGLAGRYVAWRTVPYYVYDPIVRFWIVFFDSKGPSETVYFDGMRDHKTIQGTMSGLHRRGSWVVVRD